MRMMLSFSFALLSFVMTNKAIAGQKLRYNFSCGKVIYHKTLWGSSPRSTDENYLISLQGVDKDNLYLYINSFTYAQIELKEEFARFKKKKEINPKTLSYYYEFSENRLGTIQGFYLSIPKYKPAKKTFTAFLRYDVFRKTTIADKIDLDYRMTSKLLCELKELED